VEQLADPLVLFLCLLPSSGKNNPPAIDSGPQPELSEHIGERLFLLGEKLSHRFAVDFPVPWLSRAETLSGIQPRLALVGQINKFDF